jgi:lipopolysaccharide export LptBFGC system permease protein LptF
MEKKNRSSARNLLIIGLVLCLAGYGLGRISSSLGVVGDFMALAGVIVIIIAIVRAITNKPKNNERTKWEMKILLRE